MPDRDRPGILVVDDGTVYCGVVEDRMQEFLLVGPMCPDGTRRAPDGRTALEFLRKHPTKVDVVLLDVKFDLPAERLLPLPGNTALRRTQRYQGLAILREIRSRFPGLPIVMTTSQADMSLQEAGVDVEVASMIYFLEDDGLDSLRIGLNRAIEDAGLSPEDREAGILWGMDPALRSVRRRMEVLARGRLPMILEGETGTGKSFLARRFIHARSGRSGEFISTDLSAVPETLVATHLFGAVKGAYTGSEAVQMGMFRLAHLGSLLLDEVQNAAPEIQKQLLLVLEERRVRPIGSNTEHEVDVKIIAASNSSLARAVEEGRFRRDLFMRLSPGSRIVIPPLRERRGDLLFLARRFVEKEAEDSDTIELCAALGRRGRGSVGLRLSIGEVGPPGGDSGLELYLPAPTWKLLQAYDWPGNVRELSMVMHNLVRFTLVDALDASRKGVHLKSNRLQVDSGLVAELLLVTRSPRARTNQQSMEDGTTVTIQAGKSLNSVANSVERQYLLTLFNELDGDFAAMAERLLGDPRRARAVRLRFNRLGLKVRELIRQ